MTRRRRRFKRFESPLQDRLASFAAEARESASLFQPGAERNELLRRARKADTTSNLDARANTWPLVLSLVLLALLISAALYGLVVA
jgi:hypothetical protein